MRAVSLLAIAGLAACARDPEEAVCPDVAVGELIVTEVHGPQTPTDAANGEWIELYNASGNTIDLEGVRVRFRRKDGSSETRILVRDSVTVAAGGYVVLGLFLNDSTRPAHVDYGFAGDFTGSWLAGAAIDVESCGTRIDRATYDVLPKLGSFSLTGAMPPNADMNDDLRFWCTNAARVGATYPGSPQQANPTCP
ncbi:MAG TPA: lamin tail domain-containing protein [Kofleriaceae bacterium]|nr:lamin tail domain-containing protein [Kofleriaceae bacterium]